MVDAEFTEVKDNQEVLIRTDGTLATSVPLSIQGPDRPPACRGARRKSGHLVPLFRFDESRLSGTRSTI